MASVTIEYQRTLSISVAVQEFMELKGLTLAQLKALVQQATELSFPDEAIILGPGQPGTIDGPMRRLTVVER